MRQSRCDALSNPARLSRPEPLRSPRPIRQHRRLTRTHHRRSRYPAQTRLLPRGTTRRRAATPRNLSDPSPRDFSPRRGCIWAPAWSLCLLSLSRWGFSSRNIGFRCIPTPPWLLRLPQHKLSGLALTVRPIDANDPHPYPAARPCRPAHRPCGGVRLPRIGGHLC